MRSKQVTKLRTFHLYALLGMVLFAGAWDYSPAQNNFEPTRQELETARKWLWGNPPNGENRVERRQRMALIQAACDMLEPEEYRSYVASWGNDDEASALEEQHPALFYLRKATVHALNDIRETTVKEGMAVWHIYNMGHVFMTPDACFGIDIKARGSERLADVLDFLLITHEHNDHSSERLIKAMITAEKPVITRWRDSTTIISEPGEFKFGSCRVKIDIGDHDRTKPERLDNMLMYQVDCGDYTIYHSGDGNNFNKMKPDKEVDIFIPHVQVGMSVEEAIDHLKPNRTFVSHVMELAHSTEPPHAWRWSFDYAFDTIKNTPESEGTVLTWGERWLMPGTILK